MMNYTDLHPIAFEDYSVTRRDDPLKCPRCGESYGLHHFDDDVTTEHRCGDGAIPVQDVAIRFWCENCDCIPELRIVQHKGHTFLGWFIAGRRGIGPDHEDCYFDEPQKFSDVFEKDIQR